MAEAVLLKTLYTIVHLIGVTIGAGGAFTSDAIFLSVFKDMKVNKTELRLVKVGSAMVWLGILILLVSGYLLFSLNPEGYMSSSKFLVKMTVVAVIIVNGAILHTKLFPLLDKYVNKDLSKNSKFLEYRRALITSGAISFTSWISTIILGSLRSVPLSYFTLLGIYLMALFFAVGVANIVAPWLMPDNSNKR